MRSPCPAIRPVPAVRKLWSLHLFETVDIAIDRRMGDGVYLLITVKEFPRFDKLVIEGNDEVDNDDITKVDHAHPRAGPLAP